MPVFDAESARLFWRAREEAKGLGHAYVGTQHVLIALVQHAPESLADLLRREGLNIQHILRIAAGSGAADHRSPVNGELPISPHVGLLRTRALRIAEEWKESQVDPGHVLAAITMDVESEAAQVIEQLGINLASLAEKVKYSHSHARSKSPDQLHRGASLLALIPLPNPYSAVENRGGETWREDLTQAFAATREERYALALSLLDQAAHHPHCGWEVWLLRGCLRDQTEGESQLVEHDLRRASENAPPNGAIAWEMLGRILIGWGRHEDGFHALLRARVLNCPQSSDLRLVDSLVLALLDLRQLDSVKDRIERCQRLEAFLLSQSLTQRLRYRLLRHVIEIRLRFHEEAGSMQAAEDDRRWLDRLQNHSTPETEVPSRFEANGRRNRRNHDFGDVGGKDQPGTFQMRLFQLFHTLFCTGDHEQVLEQFGEYGQRPGRSYLIMGPSGCGKTYTCRAFVGEYRRRFKRTLPFHMVRLNEIQSRWVGDSEKALTALFDTALRNQPSVIFADEIDTIGGTREGAGGAAWRVDLTAHLLLEMDRLAEDGPFVLLLGCTNRLWSLDLAIKRRFDEIITVELPNFEVRRKILQAKLRQISAGRTAADLDIDELARQSRGLPAGDIVKALHRAVSQVLGDHGDRSRATEVRQKLTNDILLEAIEYYRRPMHLREWVQRTVEALLAAGHPDEAAEVERKYSPYVESLNIYRSDVTRLERIPKEAWLEEQQYGSLAATAWLRRGLR